ncbi:hypothetical protein ACFLY9_02350 [Patescibacteria group bacterium]
MDPKTERKVVRKEKKSISGLLAKIERLEKKLDILNTMGKTVPVMILSIGAILGSVVFLSSVAQYPETTFNLPETGEEVTEDFIMLYPEHYSSLTLPDEVIGLSLNGFYTNNEVIKFFAQKTGEEKVEISIASKESESGEYKADWESATAGSYTIWAEIESLEGSVVQSESIVVEIK